MFNYLLILHLLGAAIWTGGHLILALVILPKVLSSRNLDALLQFEQQFEKIGMPALAIQIITGLWMAHNILPNVSAWFAFDNDINILIGIKLILLLMTAAVAMHARFWAIPRLTANNLNGFAINIILVTLLSVTFVVVGTLFRTGF
ncbi:CopD family protein [Psychrobacter sp. DAB_AL32B]|uniref:CopD family protein n=1 Tax=Psychrobacter sp. DAB_AL32B TaxID=1028414 RepID=UPI000B7CE4D0|nr:CopD family protein [Psychrobacter sp. DAB_AL32B]OXL28811.1 copper resistance protein CopD [Psychrobacter sp. DAB_AL32B]